MTFFIMPRYPYGGNHALPLSFFCLFHCIQAVDPPFPMLVALTSDARKGSRDFHLACFTTLEVVKPAFCPGSGWLSPSGQFVDDKKTFLSSRRTVLDKAMEEDDSLHPKCQGNSWPIRKNHGTREGEDQIRDYLGAYCPVEAKKMINRQ